MQSTIRKHLSLAKVNSTMKMCIRDSTSAAATFRPIRAIEPSIDCMVMMMPSTAAQIPNPGIASAVRCSERDGVNLSLIHIFTG